MSTGLTACGDCGQDVKRVILFDQGTRIDLDPEPVVGGDYTIWSPSNGRQPLIWRAKHRPVKVSPPRDMPELDRKRWDGREEANARSWYVLHVCGLTAAQIVEERRVRKGA